MSANDASEMARRAAAQRQGYRKTILAGENRILSSKYSCPDDGFSYP